MTDNVVVISFPENAVAYEAYSKLTGGELAVDVRSAAVVERDADGRVRIAEGSDSASGSDLVGGSLIGMLVGVIAGPLGVLLGFGVGAATGALLDSDRDAANADVIDSFARRIPAGRNAVIAEVVENDPATLNAFVGGLRGVVTRRSVDDVLAELEDQQAAAEAAAEAARRELREKKKQERHAHREERIDALKKRFAHV